MKFAKMQGCGNDYIYFNCIKTQIVDEVKAAIELSDRHFGIGGDGIILIKDSDIADFEMCMYNADGSRGAMCGNGIRCVAKYVYDKGLIDKEEFTIESMGAVKNIELVVIDSKAELIKVDMGEPELEPEKIPVDLDGDNVINHPIRVAGKDYNMTCVSMGNPHAVIFIDEPVVDFPVAEIGKEFENHPVFPDRTNTEFVRVIDENTVEMRVWERGSGETLACGTGACATAVAAALNGFCGREVTVKLLGGELNIEWREDNRIIMTGPAQFVFEGEVPLKTL